MQTLFSAPLNENIDQLGAAVETIQRWGFNQFNRIVVMPNWVPLLVSRRSDCAFAMVNGLIAGFIAERHRSQAQHGDLLDQLLDMPAGQRLSDREIHQEAASLFVSGHETNVIALSWAGWLLARHQDVQYQLAEQVTRTLGGGIPGFADLPQLASIEQAFREAIRLYPPLYLFAREVAEEATIGGYPLPPASQVFLSPYLSNATHAGFPIPSASICPASAPTTNASGPRVPGFRLERGLRLFGTRFRRLGRNVHPGPALATIPC